MTIRPATILAVLLCAAAFAGPSRGASQTSVSTPAVRLVTLGTTAGPLPRKDRSQASNLLAINGTLYLIDAGANVTRRIVQAGYDFKKVGKVFITHDHSDHTMGLADLIVTEWEFQRRDPIDIAGPPGTEAVVNGALQFARVIEEIRYAEGKTSPLAGIVRARDVAPGEIYRDAHVVVTAVENTHFHFKPGTPPYGKYTSYAYKFQTPTATIVFTGDTGPSAAVTALAKGADILVSEVLSVDDIIALYTGNGVWQAKTREEQEGFVRHLKEEHLTPDDVAKMASAAGVKTVILTHLPPTADPNDEYARYADQVRKGFSGRVLVAKDLMVFTP